MKCRDVHKLLSDYLEKDLSREQHNEVKLHLAQCPQCKEEFSLLKKIKNETVSLKKVKAPDNFLEEIRQRLEKPSLPARIKEALFYPMRIKLPLEAVGVAAITLLFVLIYNPFRPSHLQYHEDETPGYYSEQEKAEESAVARDTDEKADRGIPRMMTAKRGSRTEQLKDIPSVAAGNGMKKREKGDSDQKGLVSEERDDSADSGYEVTIHLKIKVAEKDKTGTGDSLVSADKERRLSRVSKEKSSQAVQDSFSEPSVVSGDRKADNASTVRQVAESLNGRIIESRTDPQQPKKQRIIIEIPAKNYKKLVDSLPDEWEIEKQDPATIERRSENLKVDMELSN